MRVIKLGHGPGNGYNRACLMTATSILIGEPEQLDNTGCVCPIIRSIIIPTNDAMPYKILRELYSDLMWEIVGTKIEKSSERLLIEPLRIETLKKLLQDYYSQSCYDTDYIGYIYSIIDWIKSNRSRHYNIESWRPFRTIILELCKIGDKRPIEIVLTYDELAEKLNHKKLCEV